jgi:hypothetical protein
MPWPFSFSTQRSPRRHCIRPGVSQTRDRTIHGQFALRTHLDRVDAMFIPDQGRLRTRRESYRSPQSGSDQTTDAAQRHPRCFAESRPHALRGPGPRPSTSSARPRGALRQARTSQERRFTRARRALVRAEGGSLRCGPPFGTPRMRSSGRSTIRPACPRSSP